MLKNRHLWISAATSPHALTTTARRRTLVLCFDGTGDQFDGDNSNVVQFLAMLKKDNNNEQLVYYQAGLGAEAGPLSNRFLATVYATYVRLLMIFDQILAWNLPSHVKNGYIFLMQNYTYGDKICIFGFSRGAYIARALAGMLQKVGLLPVDNHQQVPFAFEMYAREDEEGVKLSHMFKKTFSRTVEVEFLGVWDTVASVGIITRHLPFIHENTGVRHLRHALALDERRVKFRPQFFAAPERSAYHELSKQKREHDPALSNAYKDLVDGQSGAPDVKEVWFIGAHSDVGGGVVPNGTPHSLSRIPLRWMIRECFDCDTGLIFDAAQLQQIGLSVTMRNGKPVLGDIPKRIVPPSEKHPRDQKTRDLCAQILQQNDKQAKYNTKSFFWKNRTHRGALPLRDLDHPDQLQKQFEDHEAREELKDALSPMFDRLRARATWHLLEWIPQRRLKKARYKAMLESSQSNDADNHSWIWNRGRGRKVPHHEMLEGLKVHRSVKTRLEATHWLRERYVPRIRPDITKEFPDGRKVREAKQLSYETWNVDQLRQWEWVD